MEEKLLTTAERVIALGEEGEQIEVVAVHEQETEIRVYEGEIESFTASESQGVGPVYYTHLTLPTTPYV